LARNHPGRQLIARENSENLRKPKGPSACKRQGDVKPSIARWSEGVLRVFCSVAGFVVMAVVMPVIMVICPIGPWPGCSSVAVIVRGFGGLLLRHPVGFEQPNAEEKGSGNCPLDERRIRSFRAS